MSREREEKRMEVFLAKLTSADILNSEDIDDARDKAAKGGAAEGFLALDFPVLTPVIE
jgi:hypothetical protein